MASVEINQQLKRVEIEDFEIQNEIVFKYFDTLPYTERSEKFFESTVYRCISANGRSFIRLPFKNI